MIVRLHPATKTQVMQKTEHYRSRDFWIQENLLYVEPNFRLKKCARIVNGIAKRMEQCDLLDVGCGPAALRGMLDANVNYHGLDVALHERSLHLLEREFVTQAIAFNDKRFDVVVALGVFEYMGTREHEKLLEIRDLLKPGGRFIMSYINFSHFRRQIWPAYNNIQTIAEMRASLRTVFNIERSSPVSHHWRHRQPGKRAIPAIQLRLDWNIPCISPWLAVEYFFICSHPIGAAR